MTPAGHVDDPPTATTAAHTPTPAIRKGPLPGELTPSNAPAEEHNPPQRRKLLSEAADASSASVRKGKGKEKDSPSPAPVDARPAAARSPAAPARRAGAEDEDLENPEFLFDEEEAAPAAKSRPALEREPSAPTAPRGKAAGRDAAAKAAVEAPTDPHDALAASLRAPGLRELAAPELGEDADETHGMERKPAAARGARKSRAEARATPVEAELPAAGERGEAAPAATGQPAAERSHEDASSSRRQVHAASESLRAPAAAGADRETAPAARAADPAEAEQESAAGAAFERWSRWAAVALSLLICASGLRILARNDARLRHGPAAVETSGWEIRDVEVLQLHDERGKPVLAVRGRLRSAGSSAAPGVRATLLGASGDAVGGPIRSVHPWLDWTALSPQQLRNYLDQISRAGDSRGGDGGAARPLPGPGPAEPSAPADLDPRVDPAMETGPAPNRDGFTILIPDPPQSVRRFRLEVAPRP